MTNEMPPATEEPWEDTIDSFTAAHMLNVNDNHLRQIVFQKKIKKVGIRRRRALFKKEDIMKIVEERRAQDEYKMQRVKELYTPTEAIGTSQADHPQE
jgi:hypothetical protein